MRFDRNQKHEFFDINIEASSVKHKKFQLSFVRTRVEIRPVTYAINTNSTILLFVNLMGVYTSNFHLQNTSVRSPRRKIINTRRKKMSVGLLESRSTLRNLVHHYKSRLSFAPAQVNSLGRIRMSNIGYK